MPNVRSGGEILRLIVALAGLVTVWIGCDLTSKPIDIGGPMNTSFNPLGVPLVAVGVLGAALAPARGWVLVWLLVACVTLATAGTNFWYYLPIEDGAFQSLRTGMPDTDPWPAPAFLYALAFAPAGVAYAALLPGARHIVPLLLASAGAAASAAFGLQAFANALLQSGAELGLVIGTVAASAAVALVALRGGHPAGRAIAGQAIVLAVLCPALWIAYKLVLWFSNVEPV